VDATSYGRPDAVETITRSQRVEPAPNPTPSVVRQLAWTAGATAPPRPVIDVRLTNVGSVMLLLLGAGIPHRHRVTVHVTTDGLTIVHIGSKTFRLTAGRHTLSVRA
jgi:hypothetical protein